MRTEGGESVDKRRRKCGQNILYNTIMYAAFTSSENVELILDAPVILFDLAQHAQTLAIMSR